MIAAEDAEVNMNDVAITNALILFIIMSFAPIFSKLTPCSPEKCERSEYFVRWSYLLGTVPNYSAVSSAIVFFISMIEPVIKNCALGLCLLNFKLLLGVLFIKGGQ